MDARAKAARAATGGLMLTTMRPGIILSVVLAVLASLPADADEDFLPPERAFAYLVQIEGDCLKVQWNVAPGYYLYKSRMGIDSATPGVKVGTAHFPQGENHHDEYFGDQEIFRDDFVVRAPLTRTGSFAPEMTVKLKWQGCADAGLCYPVTTWEARVKFAAVP